MKVGTYEIDGRYVPAVFYPDSNTVTVYPESTVKELLEAAMAGETPESEGKEVELDETRVGPPVPKPPKLICFGLNYEEHVEELKEMGMTIPNEPVMTMKAPTAVIGNFDTVLLPRDVGRVDHELELAAVIGRRCRKATPDEAKERVAGFTVINDVTARDVEKREGQWVRAKSYDTFAPLGPWVETDVDPTEGLEMILKVNGDVRQRGNTADMVRDPYELVSFTSHVMTLEPGDVIATGTPPGVGPMGPGDRVELEIESVGRLVHHVESETGR